MRDFAIIILLVFGLCSCKNTDGNIEGTWILSYLIGPDGKAQFLDIDSTTLLKIEGNTLNIRKFKTSRNGKKPKDTTVTFRLEENRIEIENFSLFGADLKLDKDSIVGIFPEKETERIIFKKLPSTTRKISWNPVNKHYRFNGNKSLVRADFLNDSTIFQYSSEHISKVDWWFEQFDNYTFLVLKNRVYTIPMLIDSVSENRVYLKSIEDKVRNYEYQKQEPTEITGLLGEWKFIETEAANHQFESPRPLTPNYIEHLKIYEDSLIMISNGLESKHEWTLSGSGNLMFVANKKYRTFEILELNDINLVLKIGMESINNEKRLIYRRE